MFIDVSIENHRVVKILLFLLWDATFPTGSIPRQLRRMTALQWLYLGYNKLTGEASTCGDASVIDSIVGSCCPCDGGICPLIVGK